MLVIRRVCTLGLIVSLIDSFRILLPNPNIFSAVAILASLLLMLALWLSGSLSLPARIVTAVSAALGIMLSAISLLGWVPLIR